MYISNAILVIIIVAVSLCWSYNVSNIRKENEENINKIKKELNDTISKHKQEIENLNDNYLKKEFKIVLNTCNEKKIEDTMNLLDSTGLLNEFISSETLKQKNNVIKKSIQNIEEKRNFEIFYKAEILPLIKQRDADEFDIENIEYNLWKKYLLYPSINSKDKLNQLKFYYTYNVNQNSKLLIDIANKLFEVNTDTENKILSKNELICLLKLYNRSFDLNFTTEQLQDFLEDINFQYNYKTEYGLQCIFISLLYNSQKQTKTFDDFFNEMKFKHFDIFNYDIKK